jgi:hypothetical protein
MFIAGSLVAFVVLLIGLHISKKPGLVFDHDVVFRVPKDCQPWTRQLIEASKVAAQEMMSGPRAHRFEKDRRYE